MTTTEGANPTRLSPDHIKVLGTDLLCELADVAGDPAAVAKLLNHWLDVLDVPELPMVCSSALYQAFAECITVVRPEERKTA